MAEQNGIVPAAIRVLRPRPPLRVPVRLCTESQSTIPEQPFPMPRTHDQGSPRQLHEEALQDVRQSAGKEPSHIREFLAYSHIRKVISEALSGKMEEMDGYSRTHSIGLRSWIWLYVQLEECAVWLDKHSRFSLGIVPNRERARERQNIPSGRDHCVSVPFEN